MPFLEAIEEFIRRGTIEGGGLGILTPEEFYALSDAYRTRAFTASRLLTEELVRRAYDALVAALEQGGTLRDFARALGAGEVVAGPGSTGYLETVFRTNIQGAYGAGRYRQIKAIASDPDLAAARPYVEYRTAGDNRVRPAHVALDRTVYRVDSAAWERIAPPNGFNCRCSMVLRRARDVDARRVIDDPPERADDGFDAPPAPEL
ncbi:phage minor head protein [Sandaracinus amylolyticus]|uniref:Phage (Mu-like) virion morphogenesis protein n=1 Tax=Sandaracinus amylolyticus TaxID=927083 RepID=A0A0F6SGL0_9BACT|nr:phage minor head protein [Sandaracinus amylolyticus]AKF08879.1 Phage (Mu-like) virion morphogenesis protein [Sandaracinus amylolyticus]